MKFPSIASTVGVLALFASTGLAAEDFYVGTYTKFFGSKGIYRFQLDEKSGAVSPGQLAVKTASPSWVLIHPNRRWVYSVNEGPEGKVSAFRIAPDGQLQLLSQQSSKGADPCHLSLDQTHRFLFVANYSSGSVASLPVQRGGAVGPIVSFQLQHGGGVNKDRQEGPHAHSIYPGPGNNFIYSCDLGNDHIERYRFNEAGFLSADAYLDSHRDVPAVRRICAALALSRPDRFENSFLSFLCPFELLTFVLRKP